MLVLRNKFRIWGNQTNKIKGNTKARQYYTVISLISQLIQTNTINFDLLKIQLSRHFAVLRAGNPIIECKVKLLLTI